MQRTLGRWMLILGGLFACMVVALLAFFALDYATATAMPTPPIITLTETYPESPVAAGQSVMVFGQATDADGIAVVQLWVNGQMVASQTNPDPGSDQPFEVSQAWIPTGPANYVVLLRALDGKGSAGQSQPRMIEATARSYSHEVAQGETTAKIAEEFGTTPEDIKQRNPGVGDTPAPGTSLDVPAAAASEASDSSGDPPAGDEPEAPPRVDSPAPVPPPSGDETPAEPAAPAYWRYLPLPRNFVCVFAPGTCSAPRVDDVLTPPAGVGVKLHDPCQVGVGWQDASENEVGFRLYRVARRPFRIDMVGLLQASPGSGTHLFFMDENPPNQELFYFVAAYNTRGEFWSPPSETITVACRSLGIMAGWSLQIEALDMTVRDTYDRLYCYVSLSGAPFERVPHGGQFIQLESGSWNIARHFSGANKRAFFSDGRPVDIVAECLGWQGGTLSNLGRFARSHPQEEWDGRHLTAGPLDGSFGVTYRIQPFTDVEEEVGASTWALDPRIPAPYNLRTALAYRLTLPDDGSGLGGGAPAGAPGLAWDYAVDEADPREPIDFQVYYRIDGEDTPTPYHQTNSGGNLTAPQKSDRCDETVYYSVRAIVRANRSSGDVLHSPLSEELAVPARCAKLEITLISFLRRAPPIPDAPVDGEFIGAYGSRTCIGDCGQVEEVYGWMLFNNRRVIWNRHCDGCSLGGRSEYTSVEPGVAIPFADQSLSTGSGYAPNHNVFTLPVGESTRFRLTFEFRDHDFSSSDDYVCSTIDRTLHLPAGTRPDTGDLPVLGPRSQAEWLAVNQDIVVIDDELGPHCEITFHVRGVP